jgi:GH24 family phage-related lysozyme (muramidase)
MNLNELFITEDKTHIAFCYGRFQPPHFGHKLLMETTAEAADGGDYEIYTSASQDPKKNPLDYKTKIGFIKAMFPDMAQHVPDAPQLNTVMKVAADLYKRGYRSATFVAGKDQIDNFRELLTKYNGQEAAHGFYQFSPLQFIASNSPDVRATQVREAAAAGNIEAFGEMTGAGNLTQKLYDAVRAGMGIKDEQGMAEEWSQKYKSSINCSHPKGFSQKAHCAGKKKHNEDMTIEMTCPDCGMCEAHGNIMEIKKGQKDSNGYSKCWSGYHAAGTKKGKNGGRVRNCVPNESVAEALAVPPGGDPKVFALQNQLIAKGAKIKADGIMGPKTQAAMKQFSTVPSNAVRSADGTLVRTGSGGVVTTGSPAPDPKAVARAKAKLTPSQLTWLDNADPTDPAIIARMPDPEPGEVPGRSKLQAPSVNISSDADIMDMIKQHEGVRNKPYKDTKGLWTVGVGHLIGDGRTLPPEWNRTFTDAEITNLFKKDYQHHMQAAEKIPGFSNLNLNGQAALIDLTFNMGPVWWKKWPNFTKAIRAGNIAQAANELKNSQWYSQVGRRAPKIVSLLQSGGQAVAEGFNGEYDDEAGMAQSNLHTIARAAQGLLDTIGDKENLPEWAQEKIAKVEGMLVTVWDYLLSQEELGIDPQQDVSEARMSAAAKLSKAWERQQEKSAASAKRGREYMAQIKQDAANKEKKKEEVKEHKKGVRAVKHTKKSVGLDPMKPRNFVAKNALGGGAGAHKDKKKSSKQGDHKHKSKVVDIGESWELEMSNAVGMLLEAVDPKVLQLQKDLIAKGAKIQADGIMGPKTQAAMKQFGGQQAVPDRQQAVPGGWTDGSGNPIRSSDGAPVASGSTPKPSKDKPIAGVVKGGAGFTDVKTADGEVQRREGVRNWRNNNPGNIRKGKYAISKGAIGDDGAFAVFPTLDAGLKAKEDLVFGPTYINLSIRDAIARYAPPSENNTNMYIRRVVDATGASSDTVLSTLNSAQRNNMLSAINKMEGFKVGSITSLGNATA